MGSFRSYLSGHRSRRQPSVGRYGTSFDKAYFDWEAIPLDLRRSWVMKSIIDGKPLDPEPEEVEIEFSYDWESGERQTYDHPGSAPSEELSEIIRINFPGFAWTVYPVSSDLQARLLKDLGGERAFLDQIEEDDFE